MSHGRRGSSGRLWAWVPVLLLGSMLAGLGAATYLAVDDPHFALEPQYYDKAVHWDRAQSEARESAATGFSLALEPLLKSAGGDVEVRLKLLDRDGRPVSGAGVAVEAFPNAFAGRVERLSLRETTPGVYVGQLSRAELGLWELRVGATRGADRFRQVMRRDVTRGGAA